MTHYLTLKIWVSKIKYRLIGVLSIDLGFIIIIIIYISPSIDPLQGQRPTGCGVRSCMYHYERYNIQHPTLSCQMGTA